MDTKTFQNPIYLPILRGKKGEYDALKELDTDLKSKLLPLIEIPNIAWDFVKEQPATTTIKQIESSVKSIIKSWDKDYQFMVDAYLLEEDGTSNVINEIISKLHKEGFSPIPVLRVGLDDNYISILVRTNYICVRICNQDLEDFDINAEIERIKNVLNIGYENIYILLDMGAVDEKNIQMAKLFSVNLINNIHNIEKYLDVFLSLTSFPVNLSSCASNSTSTIKRVETLLHTHLHLISEKLSKVPKYSDYCISNPDVEEVDPRLMSMGAAIRYTTKDYWHIFKGGAIKKYGFEQYYELSEDVIKSPVYSGQDFSWGDKQIYEKATRKKSSGNATTWRQIATNHHITFMIKILSI